VKDLAPHGEHQFALTEFHLFARMPHAIAKEQQNLVEWATWPLLIAIITND